MLVDFFEAGGGRVGVHGFGVNRYEESATICEK